jgi:hypothetical protein
MAAPQHGTGARKRPCFFFGAALLVALAVTGESQARPAAGGRIRPPPQASACAGELTSYFGKVVGYKRGKASTWLKIATDYDTVEAVTIAHPGAKDASKHYLYRFQPFTAKDWTRIESKPGVLRPGTRATAWVCDGKVTVVDWNGATE